MEQIFFVEKNHFWGWGLAKNPRKLGFLLIFGPYTSFSNFWSLSSYFCGKWLGNVLKRIKFLNSKKKNFEKIFSSFRDIWVWSFGETPADAIFCPFFGSFFNSWPLYINFCGFFTGNVLKRRQFLKIYRKNYENIFSSFRDIWIWSFWETLRMPFFADFYSFKFFLTLYISFCGIWLGNVSGFKLPAHYHVYQF